MEFLPYQCPENYFKCPGNYCIPLRSLCDGEWQCPEGEDEAECGKYIRYNSFLVSVFKGLHHCFTIIN